MEEIDKKWLVKSANVILGPYSKKEIEQLVSDAIISINDEITEPYTFWWTLQDHPEFKDFAQNVSLQTRVTHLITGIGSRLATITSKTEKNQETTQTLTPTPSVEEAVFQPMDLEGEPTAPSPPPDKTSFQSKLESRKEAAKRTHRIVSRIWQGIVFIALSIVLYIAYNEFLIPSQKKVESLNSTQIGMEAYKKGNEEKAFEYLSKGLKENVLKGEEIVALSSLLLKKNKVEQANETLQTLPSSLFNSVKVLSLKGLAHLREKNFTVAESFFSKAKELEEKSNKIPLRSLINLALLSYIKKDYASTEELINKLIKTGYERGLLYYLRILNNLGQQMSKEKIERNIKTFIKFDPEYRQEFYVLLAYLNQKDKAQREDYIEKALNEDPYFTEEYDYDLFTGSYLLDWSHLVPYCKDLFEEDMESPLINGLYGFCLIKSQKKRQAQIYLETARKQASDNPLVASVYVYGLIERESFVQAESLLDIIQKNNTHKNYIIPYILKARIYELKREWPLVALSLKSLLEINSSHLSGNGGMAYASFQLGDKKAYLTHKERALRMYPHYKKLLILKNSDLPGTAL